MKPPGVEDLLSLAVDDVDGDEEVEHGEDEGRAPF